MHGCTLFIVNLFFTFDALTRLDWNSGGGQKFFISRRHRFFFFLNQMYPYLHRRGFINELHNKVSVFQAGGKGVSWDVYSDKKSERI